MARNDDAPGGVDEGGTEMIKFKTWPRVVVLRHPFDFGNERVTKLEFRRGKLGDAKGLNLSEGLSMDDLFTIAARLSGRPPKLIGELDAEDAPEVMEVAMDFFSSCLGAGKTRSP